MAELTIPVAAEEIRVARAAKQRRVRGAARGQPRALAEQRLDDARRCLRGAGAMAELAVTTVAPRERVALRGDGQREARSTRDMLDLDCAERRHAQRARRLVCLPLPLGGRDLGAQLALTVVAPRPQLALGGHRHRVGRARGHGPHAAQTTNLLGQRHVVGNRALAELRAAAAPRADRAGAQRTEGVRAAASDGGAA